MNYKTIYPNFGGDKDAEIVWLQGQVKHWASFAEFMQRRLEFRRDLWEAKMELDLLHARGSLEARDRIVVLERELAKLLATLHEGAFTGAGVEAVNRATMTLGLGIAGRGLNGGGCVVAPSQAAQDSAPSAVSAPCNFRAEEDGETDQA